MYFRHRGLAFMSRASNYNTKHELEDYNDTAKDMHSKLIARGIELVPFNLIGSY